MDRGGEGPQPSLLPAAYPSLPLEGLDVTCILENQDESGRQETQRSVSATSECFVRWPPPYEGRSHRDSTTLHFLQRWSECLNRPRNTQGHPAAPRGMFRLACKAAKGIRMPSLH